MDPTSADPHITHTIADGIVYLEYFGKVTSHHIIQSREAFLADPDYAVGMSFLVDLSGASLESLTLDELRRVGDHGRNIDERLGNHCTAIVAPRDLEYGVSRMFEILGERPNLRLQVFRDRGEALAWLGQ
jgi:hypothetical protein